MPKQSERQESRRPEAVFRIGYVSASVFVHDVETDDGKRSLRSVSVQKRYMDGDEAKYTSSFGLAELPQAIRALQLAQEYVEGKEAQIALND